MYKWIEDSDEGFGLKTWVNWYVRDEENGFTSPYYKALEELNITRIFEENGDEIMKAIDEGVFTDEEVRVLKKVVGDRMEGMNEEKEVEAWVNEKIPLLVNVLADRFFECKLNSETERTTVVLLHYFIRGLVSEGIAVDYEALTQRSRIVYSMSGGLLKGG